GPAVVTFIKSAVASDQIVIRIVWIDPDFVIVDVLGSFTEPPQGPAAIVRNHQKHVHHIEAIDVLRIGDNSRVVHGGHVILVAPFPATTAIVRTKDAALAIGGLDL